MLFNNMIFFTDSLKERLMIYILILLLLKWK